MPPVSTRRKKRNPGPEKRSQSLARTAADVMGMIVRDKSKDWTIEEIASAAMSRGLVPAEVFKEAAEKQARRWLGDGCRARKMNVGTEEHPKMVREFGVYRVYEIGANGKDVERRCWQKWLDMEKWQQEDGLKALFKMANAMKREAILTEKFINEDRAARGLPPLDSTVIHG